MMPSPLVLKIVSKDSQVYTYRTISLQLFLLYTDKVRKLPNYYEELAPGLVLGGKKFAAARLQPYYVKPKKILKEPALYVFSFTLK
jgi:hypothetical protein